MAGIVEAAVDDSGDNPAVATHHLALGESVVGMTCQAGVVDLLDPRMALQEFGAGRFEIVTPPESILAEPPVAVVEKVSQKHHTTDVARAYLDFLYSETGQDIIGKNFYRPISPKALAKYAGQFKSLKLYSFQSVFGTWRQTQAKHFADNGVFDQIYSSPR